MKSMLEIIIGWLIVIDALGTMMWCSYIWVMMMINDVESERKRLTKKIGLIMIGGIGLLILWQCCLEVVS